MIFTKTAGLNQYNMAKNSFLRKKRLILVKRLYRMRIAEAAASVKTAFARRFETLPLPLAFRPVTKTV